MPSTPRIPVRMAAGIAIVLAGGLVMGIGVMTLLNAAAAQTIDPDLFAEPDTPTRQLLAFLGNPDLPEETALSGMMFVFNGGILLLAGFLLIWHSLAGTVDTAREGRWGFGGWEIVRIVLAIALMAPITGGLNSAQYGVLSLARLGGDFANAVWRPFSVSVLQGNPVVPHVFTAPWRTAIGAALVAETCMHVANANVQDGRGPYITTGTEDVVPSVIRHYNGAASRGLPADLCGRIEYEGTRRLFTTPPGVSTEDQIPTAPQQRVLDTNAPVPGAHLRAMESALPRLRTIAEEIGNRFIPGHALYGAPLPDIAAMIDATGIPQSYQAAIAAAAQATATQQRRLLEQDVADDADTASWLSAASFFMSMAARIGRAQEEASTAPAVALPLAELETHIPQSHAAVEAVTRALANSPFPPVPFAPAAGTGARMPTVTGQDRAVINSLFEFIDLSAVTIADSGNPIADLAAFGHSLLNAGFASIGILAAAAAATGIFSGMPVIGGVTAAFSQVWQVTDGLVSLVIGLLLIAGAVLAYLLPALPFIRFLFGIVGWLITVISAVLAVTVFCAAHITRGDGNRLTTQATRHGWLFLPALILRPPLMLLGLILGYFLFVAIIGLFNAAWLPLLRDINASSGLGPVGYLANLTIYVMIAYTLMNTAFQLIDILPDAIMQWIGGAPARDGGAADRVGGVVAGSFGRLGGVRIAGRAAGFARSRPSTQPASPGTPSAPPTAPTPPAT